MKIANCLLVLGALLALAGCGGTGTPGGPGTKTEGGQPNKGNLGKPADDTFTIDVPLISTKLKQGESKSVTFSLKRGTNFDEDVTLKFDTLPKGVTIEPSRPKISKSEKEAPATIKAAEDAAIGDFTIKVTGEPSRGPPATNTLKVTVEKAGS